MTYASTSVDRRADYYARCAEHIAADPLDFYTRAEKGRRFIAAHLNPYVTQAPRAIVDQYLSDVSRNTLPKQSQPLLPYREVARAHR